MQPFQHGRFGDTRLVVNLVNALEVMVCRDGLVILLGGTWEFIKAQYSSY
jgi:hypothetical protein